MQASTGLALFETAIGHCGIAWSDCGITAVQLPESTPAKTLARLKSRFVGLKEGGPPKSVREAIQAIRALLDGERIDLAVVTLDFDDIDAWCRSVYEVARTIAPGETLTYGDIAERLGDPIRARDVGQALAINPWPIIVPCHRVIAAKGKTGGFSARGGVKTKLRLLAIESAHASASLPLFAEKFIRP
jgi:methylated-DNA-[protein]-cysteine S-methyltransferase